VLGSYADISHLCLQGGGYTLKTTQLPQDR